MDDTIYRQAAIDAINQICPIDTEYDCTLLDRVDVRCVLTDLPSAQPEIIRCKDCKYRDENWRRVSVRWLPCMDVRTGSNWYCGSAERKDDE